MIIKVLLVLLYIKNVFCVCNADVRQSGFDKNRKKVEIKKSGKLDSRIQESSGLFKSNTEGFYYTINDGGGKPEIYEIDSNGYIHTILPVPDARNVDWEAITGDDSGNIYIGDFGNNTNSRKDLVIYKFKPSEGKTEKISFTFEDQDAFPPPRKNKNYDCESFFWLNDSLYLFSKNRGANEVKIYKLPSEPGSWKAVVSQRLKINAMITGASYDPIGKKCVIVGYGKLYLLKLEEKANMMLIPDLCLNFDNSGQAEAVTFIDTESFLITNEQGKIFKGIIQ